jgi:hypothetical protein
MASNYSYTYAVLEVSKDTYDEIYRLLHAAGYEHAFHSGPKGEVIDMHGIAIKKEEKDAGQ